MTCRRPCLLLLTATLGAADPLAGSWVLREAVDLSPVIEAATQDMNFLTRPIARKRLRNLNPAYGRVTLAQGPQGWSIAFDTRAPLVLPVDGRAVAWTREDGERFQVSGRQEGTRLVQHFRGQDGERTNTFERDRAGGLTLAVEVRSTKLPRPLTYTLRYVTR